MKKNKAFLFAETVNDSLGNIERLFSVIVMLALVITTMIFISCRYVIHISVPWSDEIARFVLVALGWIGASYCTYHNDHLRINAVSGLVKRFSKHSELILTLVELTTQLIIGLFMLFFLRNFLTYLTKLVIPMHDVSPALQVPNWIPMVSIVIASVLMVIHSFLKVFIMIGQIIHKEYKSNPASEVEEM